MRRYLLPVSFCCLIAVGLLPAQDDAELSKAMKTIGKSMNNLKGMETKTGPEAVANAEKLVASYQTTATYWSAKSVDDASKWTQESLTHAQDLLAAAKAGEQDKAAAAYKDLGGGCRTCHEAHREKLADGSYKVK